MKRAFLTLGLTLLGCGTAVAERPIDSDSVNLTSAALVKGLSSKDRQEQERARMYLLGVLDTTEGRAWCGYNVAKTDSLQELVYEALKNSPPDSRAATETETALAKTLPCKDRK
jgi:hypothetical protein